MPRDPDDDTLTAFHDTIVRPLCLDFAARIGADEPHSFDETDQLGTRIDLPRAFRLKTCQHFTVILEEFDDDAFVIKASRLDDNNNLRRLGLVRYDELKQTSGYNKAANRVQEELNTAFEQLRQHVSDEKSP